MLPASPADPGSGSAVTPAALKVPVTALTEPWFPAHDLARFSSPSSPRSGSPHLKSKRTLQTQFSPLIQQLCAPSVTSIVLPEF